MVFSLSTFLLYQNTQTVIRGRKLTDNQILRLIKSLNIPVSSPKADEMEAAIQSAGMDMPKEIWAKKEKKIGPPQSARFAYGTTKEMPEPSLKPKSKKPKLDEDNLAQSDRALNFTASVSDILLSYENLESYSTCTFSNLSSTLSNVIAPQAASAS